MIRLVVLLLGTALVLYAVFWAIDRRRSRGGGGGGSAAGPARPKPRGPIGPDDDEDFLRNLDRERRRTKPEPPASPPTSQENNDHPE